jgi:hypothetical protein
MTKFFNTTARPLTLNYSVPVFDNEKKVTHHRMESVVFVPGEVTEIGEDTLAGAKSNKMFGIWMKEKLVVEGTEAPVELPPGFVAKEEEEEEEEEKTEKKKSSRKKGKRSV